MRIVKIILAAIVLVALGGYMYLFRFEPWRWHVTTRRKSIEALKVAQQEGQLKEAVKPYGVFVSAKDGSWVAIRYRDVHSIPIQSLSVARDSGGKWFTCDRHFCGWLTAFARERVNHDINLLREQFPASANRKGEAGYDRMEALFSAADLVGIRGALKAMDFEEITIN